MDLLEWPSLGLLSNRAGPSPGGKRLGPRPVDREGLARLQRPRPSELSWLLGACASFQSRNPTREWLALPGGSISASPGGSLHPRASMAFNHVFALMCSRYSQQQMPAGSLAAGKKCITTSESSLLDQITE